MPRRSSTELGNVDSAIARFLTEFARYLLAAGLSHVQFTELARAAYFRAARESATFRNRRVNHSAVAAMTGLTRLQVRKLAKQGAVPRMAGRDRLAKIIEGWTTDPKFLKADLTPRRLSYRGRGSGFADLVRKYGGDIPPRATLQEMLRNHSVVIKGEFAQLESAAQGTKGQARLRRISEALADLIAGASLDPDSYPIRSISREITYPEASKKGRILLQKRSAESLRAFMAELQAAAAAIAIESPPSSKARRVSRTRVLLVSEEISVDN